MLPQMNNALLGLARQNPMAPPVYGGLMTPDGAAQYDYPCDEVIALNGRVTHVIKTDTDADFHLCALIVNSYTSIRFSIQYNINGVYYTSENPVMAGNLASDPAAPAPVMGKFVIPRGANINVLLEDFSGAENTVEILFRGMKLYGNNRGN